MSRNRRSTGWLFKISKAFMALPHVPITSINSTCSVCFCKSVRANGSSSTIRVSIFILNEGLVQ